MLILFGIIRALGLGHVFKERTLFFCLCLLFVHSNATFGSDPSVSKEYHIKAAYLYHFTKFVEWPASAFASDQGPIIIGVFGKNPFGGELKRAVEERNVNARKFAIREVRELADLKSVHVLFIPASEDDRVAELIPELRGASVLTVGESSRFVEAGGIIRFVQEEDKIRFEIAIHSARDCNLKISAQLQKLARASTRNE